MAPTGPVSTADLAGSAQGPQQGKPRHREGASKPLPLRARTGEHLVVWPRSIGPPTRQRPGPRRLRLRRLIGAPNRNATWRRRLRTSRSQTSVRLRTLGSLRSRARVSIDSRNIMLQAVQPRSKGRRAMRPVRNTLRQSRKEGKNGNNLSYLGAACWRGDGTPSAAPAGGQTDV
jgi:hypothetical protein